MNTLYCALTSAIDLPLLVSARMPADFLHGFTTRQGGVSLPPYDSLNLGHRWGDDVASIEENRRRLLAVSGASTMFRVSQVHGTRIVRLRRGDSAAVVGEQEADGLCSDERGIALSVHVADCTPILMACPETGACAALHAGWRGTVAGMAGEGVRAMAQHFGCRPQSLRVALGPCIGRCCFEVGPEVALAFVSAMPNADEAGVLIRAENRKARIDLRRFQELELEAAGVDPANIDRSQDCTHCDPNRRFYSFRKAGRATGQSVGFIVRSR